MNIYVEYLRKYILPEEFNTDDAKVFLNWGGKPLAQGEVNKKVQSFFRRYGYDLSITRLRSILATHIEESSNDLTNEGKKLIFVFLSPVEYSALVETSQTHNMSVHQKFYVKKRRVCQDATTIPLAYNKVVPECSLTKVGTSVYQELFDHLPLSDDDERSFHHPPADHEDDKTVEGNQDADFPSEVIDLQRLKQMIHPPKQIGSARADYLSKGKRFPWIQEEIDYFHEYFSSTEPILNEDQLSKKYATCLQFLKNEGQDVLKYFHPYHLENSDRLKTGYLKAKESFRG